MYKVSTRDAALALDAADALAPLRDEFALPDGVVYLDGNSLGALPRRTAARVQQTVEDEWGRGLIRSWNEAGWIGLAHEIGDAIADLVGAHPGEVSVGDSTSVNLFKALNEAKAMAMERMQNPRIVPLAWYRDAWEEQEKVLGSDPWQYGLTEANRKNLTTLIGYSHEQGLIKKKPELEQLFLNVSQGEKRGVEFRI